MMKGIHSFIQSQKDIQTIIEGINSGLNEQLVAGLSGSARSLLVATLYQSVQRPILLVTHQLTQAQQLYDDLSEFIDEDEIFLYPVNELIATDLAIASPELKSERIESLTK